MISPTRELVKEGKIKRISAHDGDIMDRYVFLVRQQYVVNTKCSLCICVTLTIFLNGLI